MNGFDMLAKMRMDPVIKKALDYLPKKKKIITFKKEGSLIKKLRLWLLENKINKKFHKTFQKALSDYLIYGHAEVNCED